MVYASQKLHDFTVGGHFLHMNEWLREIHRQYWQIDHNRLTTNLTGCVWLMEFVVGAIAVDCGNDIVSAFYILPERQSQYLII